MSEIWKTATLSEFVKEFIVPQRDKPTTFGGDIPWCRIEDFEGPYLSASKSGKCVTTKSVTEMPLRVFPTNTVLVSCSANLGKCAITTRPLVTNQTFIGLVPKDAVDSKFLYYLMGSKAALLNEMATGVTIRYLSREKFSNLPVSIPSLPEQQRIVRLLDEAFEAIAIAKANAEKNFQNARTLFESQLASIYLGGSGMWPSAPLGEICEVLDSLRKPVTKRDRTAGSYPYYGATGVVDHVADYLFDEPLVLIGEDGARWDAGAKSAFLVSGKVWVNNHAHVVRPDRQRVLDQWLVFYMNQTDLIKYVSGLTVPKLNQGNLREIPIPIPKIDEQQLIVDKLKELESSTNYLAKTYAAKIRACEELRASLLNEAFAGNLMAA